MATKFLNKFKVASVHPNDDNPNADQPVAWQPTTAVPMWPPPGHSGWTPPPGAVPGQNQGFFGGNQFGFGTGPDGRPMFVVNPMQLMSMSKNKFTQTKSFLVKFIEFSRTFTEKWFSHIMLIGVLILYAALGAWMFMVLEGEPPDDEVSVQGTGIKERIKREIVNYSSYENNGSIPRNQLENLIDSKLMEFENEVIGRLKSGSPPPSPEVQRTYWTFWRSFVYCFTVFTTIGYGHVAPVTRLGRAATIAYACVGIPLLLMVLADLGRMFTRMIKYGFKRLRKLFMAKKLRKIRHAGRRATLVPQYMAHMAHTAQNKLESTGLKVKKSLNAANLEAISDSNQGSKLSVNENISEDAMNSRKSSLNPNDSGSNTLERPQRKKKRVNLNTDSNDNQIKSSNHGLNVQFSEPKKSSLHTTIDVPMESVPMVQVTAPQSPQFMFSPGINHGAHPLTAHPLGHNVHPLLMASSTGLTPTPVTDLNLNENGEIILDGDQEIQEIVDPVTGQKSVFIVDDEFNLPVSLALLILVLYMMFGALLFTISDNWSFFDSFYFVFISISTIGFGDLTPSSDLWMIFASIYLLFGLALTSMCINVIQEALGTAFEEAKLRLGTRIGFDVDGQHISDVGHDLIQGTDITSDNGGGPCPSTDSPKREKDVTKDISKEGQREGRSNSTSRRGSEEEKLRRKARAESQERRRKREEKQKRSDYRTDKNTDKSTQGQGQKDNGQRKGSKDSESSGSGKDKKRIEDKITKKNVSKTETVKQNAPLITFKLNQGADVGKTLKDRREKKRREGEFSPSILDTDSPSSMLNEVNYTTTVDYGSNQGNTAIRPSSPVGSAKSDYEDCS